MDSIKVERLGSEELDKRGVRDWPIWEKEESQFPWSYDDREQCLLLRGDVTVRTDDGQEVRIEQGDFVTFAKGLSCEWIIHKAVRKHYNFG